LRFRDVCNRIALKDRDVNTIRRYTVLAAVAAFAIKPGSAAESIVINDIGGNWEQVRSPRQYLSRYQHLPERERVRFVPAEPFAPGFIVVTDLLGNTLYSKACPSRQPCEGIIELPAVPTPAKPPSSIFERVFGPVTEFISRDPRPVNLIGNNSPQGGILRNAVLSADNDSLDLCAAFKTMNPGRYNLELSTPDGGKIGGEVNWARDCPISARFAGLLPGTYILHSTDASNLENYAVVLVCPRISYQSAANEFTAIEVATESWLQPTSSGAPVRDATRQGFLAGYLLWRATSSPSATGQDPGKRNR
jgi:hypothetical protein